MSQVKLGSVANITQGGRLKLTGKNFVEKGFPAYGAGGINGYLQEHEFDKDGVILSANGARCGKCFYAQGKWTSLANTQIILPDISKAIPKFLWYQLNDERKWRRAGTAQPFIKPSDVKNKEIFLPEIKEQNRIVDILDVADALRQKRKQSLQLLDDFLRATFLDMFGDPLAKRNKFKTVPLGSMVDFIGGGTPSRKISEYWQGKHKWASSKDMKGLILKDTQERISDNAVKESVTKLVNPGTLLVVVKSKILLRYLPVLISESEVCFNQDIKGMVPNKDIDSWYLLFHMRIGQDALLQIARGANTEGLTLDHLRNYKLILAPKDIQEQFSVIAKKTVTMIENMQKSQNELDNQFNALTQRYFE